MDVEVVGTTSLAIDSAWLIKWRAYASSLFSSPLVKYYNLCAPLALELYLGNLCTEFELHSMDIEVIEMPSLAINSAWLTEWRAHASSLFSSPLVEC